MERIDLFEKFVKEGMDEKTENTCDKLASVISSLEALEANEHDATCKISHKDWVAIKDQLFQEIFNDFLQYLLDDAEEARKVALEFSEVLSAAYDNGLPEEDQNVQDAQKSFCEAWAVYEDKLNLILSLGN